MTLFIVIYVSFIVVSVIAALFDLPEQWDDESDPTPTKGPTP